MTEVVVLSATLVAAMAQTVAGFGFALIAVPFFVTVLSVQESVGIVALLSFANVTTVARGLRGHVPWPIVRYLLVGSLCGMPFGLALLLGMSGDVLRVGVGLVSILMATVIGAGFTVAASGSGRTAAVGFTSGVLCTSIAMNGPPIVLYLQALRFPPDVFRAALSTFFLLNSLVSLSVFVATGVISWGTLGPVALGLPALFLGHWLGLQLLPRFRPETFRRFVLLLLVVSASTSIIDGLVRSFG